MSAGVCLWPGSASRELHRRPTTEILAVVIDTTCKTEPPPPKTCALCGTATTHEEWLATPSRRAWPSLRAEIAEPCCPSTLAVPVNPLPAIVR